MNDKFEEVLKSSFRPVKVGDLLRTKLFSVPSNQRNYSWNTEKWEELWNDLIEMVTYRNGGSLETHIIYHFMGPMFFINVDNENLFEIFDGQQRLITFTLSLQLIWDIIDFIRDGFRLSEEGRKIYSLVTPCIKQGSNEEKNRLYLNKQNASIFGYLMKQSSSPLDKMEGPQKKVEHISSYEIIKCYTFFFDKIMSRFSELSGKIAETPSSRVSQLETFSKEDTFQEFLFSLAEGITDGFYVVDTAIFNKEAGYEMFETLNQRGEKLLTADLFKNLLFTKFGKHLSQGKIETFWDRLIDIVSEKKLKVFLRHFWISNYCFVREKKLFTKMREYLNFLDITETEFDNFTQNILNEAKIYSALMDPSSEFWKNLDKTSRLLEEIEILGFFQYRPLLLAVYQKCFQVNKSKFNEILQTYLNLIVRRYLFMKRNANEFEEDYSSMARDLRNSKIGPDDVIAFFNSKLLDNSQIIEQLSMGIELKDQQARYVLVKIEDSLAETELHSCLRNNPSLEHILPKSPSEDIKTSLKEEGVCDYSDILNRLGNLTLLSKKDNSRLSNLPFLEKRTFYIEDGLKINLPIIESYEKFGLKEINEREKVLLDIIFKNVIWG